MKQTAVEWLVEQIKKDSNLRLRGFDLYKIKEEAKEMEKQQIIDAWENGYDHGACVNEDKDKYHGTQHYNETFNNNQVKEIAERFGISESQITTKK